MKTTLYSFFMAGLLGLVACTKPGDDSVTPDTAHAQAGYAAGKVLDNQGNPLKGAEIVANNTGPYSNNSIGYSDGNGNYRIQLPSGPMVGSFYVRGSVKVKYEGQTYTLGLFTEDDGAFSADKGAVKNLRLKTSGDRTGNFGDEGYYGGQAEIDNWTQDTELSDIEVTFKPLGQLVDGSAGKKLTARPDGYYIDDVPVGKYEITARQISRNKPLAVRIRNKSQEFAKATIGTFEPIYSGSERCHLMIQISDL